MGVSDGQEVMMGRELGFNERVGGVMLEKEEGMLVREWRFEEGFWVIRS